MTECIDPVRALFNTSITMSLEQNHLK